jgi:N-methylhydantoinase A
MRVATDIGGTFTDCVYIDQNGDVGFTKSHSTPPNFEQGVMDVLRKSELNMKEISTFIHGSTVVINALTERKGVKTALITTKGMRDVLEIARGNRPDLYNFRYQKPKPFVPRHLRQEVDERLNYKGEIITPLNEEYLVSVIEYLRKENVEAIAVAFLHSYRNDIHERKAVQTIQKLWPEVAVTASSEITREWREYERTNTTVLNSYVKPIATSYLQRLKDKLHSNGIEGSTYIMRSNGGTASFEQAKETPITLVESGPVAGILGAAVLGEMIGEKNILAFDIGGTTAKCSLIHQGEVKVSTDYYIERNDRFAGYPIKTPVVEIVEIGNGGGSIARIDESGSLKVGPQSAGSTPGPIAYGNGGEEPTTTDANLVTGRLSPKNFDKPINIENIKQIIENKIAHPFNSSTDDAALGIIQIANSNMLNALKLISVRKGYDPREFSMIAFGGGGPMHAPALAKELGIKKVIIPMASSVFSAWGMLMTDLRSDYLKTSILSFHKNSLEALNQALADMEDQSTKHFIEHQNHPNIIVQRYLDMRYKGQEHTVKVPLNSNKVVIEDLVEIENHFHELHEQHYSFCLPKASTEIVNIHLTLFGIVSKPIIKEQEVTGKLLKEAVKEKRSVYYENEGWLTINIYERDQLEPGMNIHGPAIVEEESSSTVIYPGQSIDVDRFGNLVVETEGVDYEV